MNKIILVLTGFFSPVFNLSYIFSVRPVVLNRSRSTNLLLSKYFILSNLSINIVNCNSFLINGQSGMKSETELPVTMERRCNGTVYALVSLTLLGGYCCNILISHALFRFNPTNLFLSKYLILSNLSINIVNCNSFLIIAQSGMKSETELPVTMGSRCKGTVYALFSLTLPHAARSCTFTVSP